MIAAALGFLAGIAAFHAQPTFPMAPAAGVVAAAAMLLGVWRPMRIPAAAALGFVLAWWQAGQRLADDWPCFRDREDRVVAGVVDSLPESGPGRVEFEFAADRLARDVGVPARIRVAWYEPITAPRPGEAWALPLRLRCRHSLLNPGGADRELALLRDGLGATAYVTRAATPHRLRPSDSHAPVTRARAWIAGQIAQATIGSASTGVLQGLAVGARGAIAEDRWRTLKTTGIAHLVAISGLHVTAFALVAVAALRLSYRLPWPATARRRRTGLEAVVMAAAAAGYTLLAGAGLPALRTLVMLLIALALLAGRRAVLPGRVLAIALVLMLAADPLAVSSPGLWLSFVAVGALLASGSASSRGATTQFARAQAAVTIALMPVVACVFGFVSVVSPLANAIAIPAFSMILLPATLLGVSLLPLVPDVATSLFRALGRALDLCWPALDALARLPLAAWYPVSPPAWLVGAGGLAAAALLLLPVRGMRVAAGAVLAAMLLRESAVPPPAEFELTVLDVGHGLAAVARTRTHTLLFDTGPAWRGGGTAADSVVLPFLRGAGVRRLDAVVLSHGDSDHAGGWRAIAAGLPVTQVWSGPGIREGRSQPCRRGTSWSWDGVRFEFMHPGRGESWSENDGSCVLLVSSSTARALLVADIERDAEAALAGAQIRADVVLVPHHGSRSSSTPGFVAATRAAIAVVSAGFGNRWGLPRPDVSARWRGAGARLITTADAGAVTVAAAPDHEKVAVTAFRDRNRRWWRSGDTPADSGKKPRR